MTTRRYALRDDQWERIKDMLPGKPGDVGVTAKDNRLFVEAVLYRYRAGIPWRDLPERFGDFRVVHTRFSRWSKKGLWLRVFATLCEDSDNEYQMIDATIVRAHQHSAGAKGGDDEAIGRSAGGLSTKIHATCDALGNPTGFFLTAGQVHDLQGADVLIADIEAEALLADKAYDADERMRAVLKAQDIEPVIPSKSNRTEPIDYDKHLYKARHLIENFFAKLKQYRAIATRYDKTARNFLSAIHMAACVIWLN
ncbi:MAG: IS5 family transposase [Cyanobacteria bacterium J06642_9]